VSLFSDGDSGSSHTSEARSEGEAGSLEDDLAEYVLNDAMSDEGGADAGEESGGSWEDIEMEEQFGD